MDAPDHLCTCNHTGSLKSKEVEAIVNLVIGHCNKKRVGIECMVCDDNTTIHAHLKQ